MFFRHGLEQSSDWLFPVFKIRSSGFVRYLSGAEIILGLIFGCGESEESHVRVA